MIPGMTLRDWFAGQAIVGYLADGRVLVRSISEDAYTLADAMLAARAATPSTFDRMQHVAYYDEGAFHWMSGVAPRECELFAKSPA